LWTHVRLAAELQQRSPDVFFTPAHVIPYSYRRPSVATIHDLGYHYFPKAHTRSQVAYLKWSTRHNGRRGRRIIADSKATRNDLVHYYDIEPGKIDVVYPGVDPGLAPVTNPEKLSAARARYDITDPYLLFIGTLQPRKNLIRLVDAFVLSGVKCQLVMAGQSGWLAGSLLTHVESMAAEYKARIILPGFVAEEDKTALISGAEALLYPSLYEGFGFPILEGNACGTPVLCSDSSSLPEVAGDAALMVDPLDMEGMADGISQIVDNQVLRQQLRQNGFANVARFSWSETALNTLSTLERAAS
jgi:glycosyltransferase involved in cell wall biosynthesis